MGRKGIDGAGVREIKNWTEAKTARWESKYFCSKPEGTRRYAKRRMARALRRAAQAQIAAELP